MTKSELLVRLRSEYTDCSYDLYKDIGFQVRLLNSLLFTASFLESNFCSIIKRENKVQVDFTKGHIVEIDVPFFVLQERILSYDSAKEKTVKINNKNLNFKITYYDEKIEILLSETILN